MADAVKNVAYSTVATPPSPDTSGTTLVVQAGEGARFPSGSFDVVVWPIAAQPVWAAGGATGGNFEICRATISTDTLTLTRAQYGTTARAIVAGDQVAQNVTAAMLAQLVPPAFATNAVLLDSTASAGAAATVMRSNDTIAAFDTTVPSTQAFGDAAAVGTAAFAARRDHKHAMPSLPVGGTVLLYDYEVSGAAKASIDTAVDGAMAGALSTAYKMLEIFFYGRTDEAVAVSTVAWTLNNDGTSIYDMVQIRDSNATLAGAPIIATAGWNLPVTGAGATAGVFGAWTLTIPNYAGTVGNKAGTAVGGSADQTAANARDYTQQIAYRSTTAISRAAIAITSGSGQKFAVGTRLTIYAR